MVPLPQNEKQTHRLNSRLQIWPSGLTLAMTLTLNFQGQIWNLLYLNQKWSDYHETKSKHIDLNSRPQMWPCGHDIDIWIFKVICDFDHLVTKVRCKDLPDSDRGDFRCRRAIDSSSFPPCHVVWRSSLDLFFFWFNFTKPNINTIDKIYQECHRHFFKNIISSCTKWLVAAHWSNTDFWIDCIYNAIWKSFIKEYAK